MSNRDNIIDVNDVERAMQEMGAQQQMRRAKQNGPIPRSSFPSEERPQHERDLSIVESVTEFSNYIAGFLERTAEEEMARTQQFAEHLRVLATKVRETGIGSQR